MPGPHWFETVKEAHILEEIREKPETRRMREHGDAEEDEPEDAHDEEEADDAEHAHAEVPHALAHHNGPQRKQYDGENQDEGADGICRVLPLRALVEPHVVHLVVGLLLLLDLDSPQALYSLLLLVVVALVAGIFVDLGHAESKEGEREELECVFGCHAVVDFWEESILGSSLLVCVRVESSNCPLHAEHVLPLLLEYARPGLQVLRLEELRHSQCLRLGRSRLYWLLLSLLLRLLLLLSLLLLSVHLRLLAHCQFTEFLGVFLNAQAEPLCIRLHVCLDHPDLLRRRLLARL